MRVINSDEELLNDRQIAQGTDYSALFVSYEDIISHLAISGANENKIIRNCYFSIGSRNKLYNFYNTFSVNFDIFIKYKHYLISCANPLLACE